MDPSQIREQILAERERSRRILDDARAIAELVMERRAEESLELHRIAQELEEAFTDLFDTEQEILDPLLRRVDAWGEERASGLSEYHRRQRVVIRVACAEVIEGRLPAWRAAAEILELLESIDEALIESERIYLSADLLRDDLVSIRQADG